MVWATVSSWSCFCWLCRASPSLAAKNIINLIPVLTIWWCPCVESCVVGRGCLLWPVHFLGKTLLVIIRRLMDRFLEKLNLPRMNQEEIEIMNNTITSTELKLWSKISQKNKSPGPVGFTGEFYQTFQRDNAYPSKTLSKNFRGKNNSKLLLQGHHHPDTKTRQRKRKKIRHKKRKLQANITDEHRCKKPPQSFSKQNSTAHQKAHTPWSSWVYSRDTRILQYTQINQCDTPY